MKRVSRRLVLAGGATIPFTQWWAGQANSGPTVVRRSLATAAGLTDLQKYAAGVKAMMAKAEADPQGWLFWWYIHSVRDDRGKTSEINRVYPPSPPPVAAWKALANATWETCQAHHGGDIEDFFLPWHRMYVLFLEATIRQLIGDPGFALPYWRYTDPAQRSLPAKFRLSGDPTWGSLYRAARNSGINTGTAIDAGLSPTPVNTDAMNETSYSGAGASAGFCDDLDNGLHGNVHVLIGNSHGMGQVPWAANDPIFWMHHNNLDRVWASWNRNGGCNPTDASWLNRTFTFPDGNGNSVVAKVTDFKAIGPLGYTYDSFEPGPTVGNCNRFRLPWWLLKPIYLYPLPWPIDPSGPVEHGLQFHAEALRGPQPEELKAIGGGRLRLLISGLSAQTAPDVLFRVSIRAGARAQPRTLGYLNFFNAVQMQHEDHMKMEQISAEEAQARARAHVVSFDVEEPVGRLLALGAKAESQPLSIQITPVGKADPRSRPTIGDIRIVRG